MLSRNLIQRSRKTEDSVAKSYYDVGKNVLNGVELESAGCDVTFVCADGSVKAHQCIVAIHSDLLRRILLPRHQIEFDIVDIDRSLAYLYGRRLPDTEVSVFVRDFDRITVKRMLSLFYTGKIPIMSKSDGRKLVEIWNCLEISSVRLADLELVPDTQSFDDQVILGAQNIRAGKQRKRRYKARPHSTESSSSGTGESSSSDSSDTGSSAKCPKTLTRVKSNDKCEFCNYRFGLARFGQNNFDFTKILLHLISHLDESLFGEIPEVDIFYCPTADCKWKNGSRSSFLLHLAQAHGELLPRIDRRLAELRQLKGETDGLVRLNRTRQFLVENVFTNDGQSSKPETLCNELDVYRALESRHGTSGSGVICDSCNDAFSSSSSAVVHLFTDHGQLFINGAGEIIPDFGLAGNPGMSLSNDVRRTFRCPVKDCTFATFRRSSIISHVGFGHKFFRQTNLRSAIRGLDLDTLFDAERRQKRDVVNDAKASCSKKANCGATILADVVDLDSDD